LNIHLPKFTEDEKIDMEAFKNVLPLFADWVSKKSAGATEEYIDLPYYQKALVGF